MLNIDNLKPCPFCGVNPLWISDAHHTTITCSNEMCPVELRVQAVRLGEDDDRRPSEIAKEATDSWNTRAATPYDDAVVIYIETRPPQPIPDNVYWHTGQGHFRDYPDNEPLSNDFQEKWRDRMNEFPTTYTSLYLKERRENDH